MTDRRTFIQAAGLGAAGYISTAGAATDSATSITEGNKAIVRQYFERCWNQGDLDFAESIIIPDYDLHLEGMAGGFAIWKAGVAAFRQSFPDIRFDNLQLIAEGDMVAVRSVFYGTHRGEFMGIPATGRKIAIRCADYYRLKQGKLVAHWDVPDFLAVYLQLGALPADVIARIPAVFQRGAWPPDVVPARA